jgi:DNA gyrase subunit A
MLIDGQGNFGSVDGDPPAAMRYTEARLTAPAIDILADLNKNTVDFTPNFDDTLQEPSVLPAAIPNLLVNGATGIAVGMATSIPPHNLGEIVDALVYMLDKWEKLDDIDVEQLMQFVQGPDFPTGGLILEQKGEDGIESAYGSGRGRVIIQANAHIEDMKGGRSRIIVTELPYQVNKSTLVERIAELARDGTLEGLADLRDESDRHGMRIVIELNKNAEPEKVLANLFRRTPMQSTFSINLLALVDGEPRTLTLKQALRVFLEHRLTVIKRRAEFDLERAGQRVHILEGYLIALKNLDELINLIRSAPDVDTARTKIMKRYKLSDLQATAILDMQLRRLAALERKKIETEYKEVTALIQDLQSLLKSAKRMRGVAAEELLRVKAAFADRRRTQIVNLKAGKTRQQVTARDLVSEKSVWVGVTADGRMARTVEDKAPRPSGLDAPRFLVRLNTADILYLVSTRGSAAAVAVHTLPEVEKLADGTPFHKVAPLRDTDTLAAVFALPTRRSDLPADTGVLTVTRGGMVKKTAIGELPGPSAQTFTMVRVNEGDSLGWVALTDGKKDILLATSAGMAIRFSEKEVRPMGLQAAGVSGIKLEDKDEVAGMEVLPAQGELFLITTDGKAKRLDQKEFPRQGRYGKGVSAWQLPGKIKIAGIASGRESATVTIHLAKSAAKSHRLDEAAIRKRAATRGDALIELKPGDEVIAVTTPWMVDRFLKVKEEATKKMAVSKAAKGKKSKAAGKPKTRSRRSARRVKGKAAVQKRAAKKTQKARLGKKKKK